MSISYEGLNFCPKEVSRFKQREAKDTYFPNIVFGEAIRNLEWQIGKEGEEKKKLGKR